MSNAEPQKIPKVINYCWFGHGHKSKLIKKCIKSWKKACPDYEIIEWNENNCKGLFNDYAEEAYKAGKWAFVADYVRLAVIYRNGGIYLDTDVELVRSLDDLLLYDSFFSLESREHVATGLGFGASKCNAYVKAMLDDYDGLHFIDKKGGNDLTPCPVRNTESIRQVFDKLDHNKDTNVVDNNIFLGKEYFCPYDPATGILKLTDKTFGIHWYSATWRKKSINARRRLLRPIKRIIGKDKFDSLKRKIRGDNND